MPEGVEVKLSADNIRPLVVGKRCIIFLLAIKVVIETIFLRVC